MAVVWADLYPSKIVRDTNGKTATRLIRVVGDDATPFDQTGVFADVVTGPAAPTTPAGGIPQRGDFFPGDTTLIAGERRVDRILGPSDVFVRIEYSRVNWGSIDTFYPGDDSAGTPPYIDLRATGQRLVTPVPRVLAFPVQDGPSFSYSIISEPRIRFQSNISATFHLTSWGSAQVATVEDALGTIDTDLSVEVGESFSAQALFTSYKATPIGQGLWRIVYEWERMSSLPALPEEIVDVPGQANPIRRLASVDVDPHSNLTPVMRPLETVAGTDQPIAAEPILVQTDPIDARAFGVTTDLPGLQHASIQI